MPAPTQIVRENRETGRSANAPHSVRVADGSHGPRAAKFAATLRGEAFELEDDAFGLLVRACEGHTHDLTHSDVTIATCYDADRLDLGRIGVVPHPSRLSTEAGRRKEMIDRCYGRGVFNVVPGLVGGEWGIELA